MQKKIRNMFPLMEGDAWKAGGALESEDVVGSERVLDSQDTNNSKGVFFESWNGTILPNHRLPYNPDLKDRAKYLRKNMTTSEKKLWFEFLKLQNFRVYPQRPIHYFIVDFYIPQYSLVIEIDGDSHFVDNGPTYDEERTQILQWYGLKIVRYTNDEVTKNFDGVCEDILKYFL